MTSSLRTGYWSSVAMKNVKATVVSYETLAMLTKITMPSFAKLSAGNMWWKWSDFGSSVKHDQILASFQKKMLSVRELRK